MLDGLERAERTTELFASLGMGSRRFRRGVQCAEGLHATRQCRCRRQLRCGPQLDGARVVDDHIDAAERLDHPSDRIVDGGRFTNIAHRLQGDAAGFRGGLGGFPSVPAIFGLGAWVFASSAICAPSAATRTAM